MGINPRMLNGVLMVLTVLITLETCQLRNLLDLTHQHLLQSLPFFSKQKQEQVLDGLSSLTVVTRIQESLSKLIFQTLPKLLANGELSLTLECQMDSNREELLNEE